MISMKTLRRWRRDALVMPTIPCDEVITSVFERENAEMRNRILRLTQELMDIYLVKKG